MAHKESKVESYIDALSSGDSNTMTSKQKTKEVNNNEVDELSKELSEMGCIVDAMKRPPNICVETCVYESDSEKSDKSQAHNDDEDAYSDEFEEDKSEDEEQSVKAVSKYDINETSDANQSSIKMSKSMASMCSNKPPASISGRSGRSDFGQIMPLLDSCFSTCFVGERQAKVPPSWLKLLGSVSVPQTRRVNMSFSNERLREIERHNHILLTKILSARNSRKSSIPPREQPVKKPVPSAAVSRRNQQKQIDHDNMILLKKIQRAKSSALSIRR